MIPQAPWSPTAHAFAHHQFSHVTNFWKQGRQASFRLEALPDGKAELSLTFQLPPASEVVPPPFHGHPVKAQQLPPAAEVVPPPPHVSPQRHIQPLFPQKSGAKSKTVSPRRRRKSYQRSVLHRAALAMSSLPPPKSGSLRQAAQVCVQRLQAAPAQQEHSQSARKRPLPNSPSDPSPSNFPPLSQRIRKGIQIGESEVESPEKEVLRSCPFNENSPALLSPCLKDIPSPVSLVFTPVAPEKPSCWNCHAEMTLDHQCETVKSDLSPGLPPSLEVLAAARKRPEPSAPYIIKGKIKYLDGSIVGHKK